MEYAYPSWLIAENGNLERHNMNLGHVSHCYAILQNLSTLVTVEISR